MSIQIKNVSKQFGNKTVLSNVNLTIQNARCTCLLGRNGAGKSTLINILSNLYSPTIGNIFINDMTYANNESAIKQIIGVLPEKLPLIGEWNVNNYLNFVCILRGISKKESDQRITSLVQYFFDDDPVNEKTINTLSFGMKVKLAICASMIHNPSIVIWDEPFTGIDPFSSEIIVKFVNNCIDSGKTFFISSHNLQYVDKIATDICIIDEGKIVYSSTYNEFTQNGKLEIEASLFSKLQWQPNEKGALQWIF